MKIIDDFNDFNNDTRAIITIGSFDGVHLGHQKILTKLGEESIKNNLRSVVVTFKLPTKSILNEENIFKKKIITTEKKIQLLKKFKIDYLININFDDSIYNMSAEKFIDEILIKKLNVKMIIAGYDFRFGKDKKGDFNLLKEYFKDDLIHIEPLIIDNEIVSSTLIKQYLLNNQMARANRLLGYEYGFSGKVIHGRGHGKQLGFPTINLEYPEDIIEILGVYKTAVVYNGSRYKGISNIGKIPTFNINTKYIETFIFDFQKDIYGEEVKVIPEKFLRDIIKFKNVDELKKQIIIDISNC